MAATTASITDQEMMTLMPSLVDNDKTGDANSQTEKSEGGDPFAEEDLDFFLDSDPNDPTSPLNFFLQQQPQQQQPELTSQQQINGTLPNSVACGVQQPLGMMQIQQQQEAMLPPVTMSLDTLQQPMAPPPPIQSVGAVYRQQVSRTPPTSESEASLSRKRPRSRRSKTKPDAVVNEQECKRRKKLDRNLREQQRSHRITEQIGELRRVLSETAGVKFGKTDKYTILTTVVDYIRQCQSRSMQLDTEHRKLVETISQTSKVSPAATNSFPSNKPIRPYDHPLGTTGIMKGILRSSPHQQPTNLPKDITYLDYKAIFSQCSAALAIVTLQGHFLDCNKEFENLSGYSRKELTDSEMSLFRFLQKKELVADARNVMCALIQDQGGGEGEADSSCFWNGKIISEKRPNWNLVMTITISRSTVDRTPLFFNCAISEQ